jgi:hypothetical protein
MAQPRPRLQVRDLRNPEALQPTPIQSDTFTGAPRVSGAGDGYMQLAEALGSFSAALGGLARQEKAKGKKDVTLENAFGKLTQSQRAQVARTGRLPDGTVIAGNENAGPAVMKAAGMADASTFERSLQQELMQEYDWSQGDIDAYLTDRQNRYMAENGVVDPFAVKGFIERFDQTRAWAREQENKYRTGQADKYKGDVTYELLQDGLYKIMQENLQPEEAHRRFRAMYKDLGKDGTLGIDYAQLDKYAVDIAGNIAETNPELALELVTGQRLGAGPASAPISSKLEFKPQVKVIVEAARKAIVKKEADQEERNLYYNNYTRIKDGDYSAFKDVNIKDGSQDGRTITAKEQAERYAEQWVQFTDSAVKDGKATPQAAAAQQVYFLRAMNIDHPYLKNEVDGIERRVDPGVVTDPNSMQDIETRIEKYRQFRSVSKNYTQSQLSQNTKDFLDAIDIAQKYERYDMPRAILFANRVTNPTEGQVQSLARYRDDITSKVKSTFSTGFFGFGNQLNNDGVMMGTYVARTESYATKLVAAGMDPEKAIDVAARRLKDSLYTYNGRAMPGLEQQPMADNWQEGLSSLIKENIIPSMSKDFEGQDVFPVVLDGGRMVFENEDGQIIKDKSGKVMATSVGLINAQSFRLSEAALEEGKTAGEKAVKESVGRHNRERRIQSGREPGFLEREGFDWPKNY